MAYWLEGAPARLQTRQSHRFETETLHLLDTPRARLHLALICCLAVAGVLAFLIFPPKRVSIQADGSDMVMVSRQRALPVLLDSAGFKREAGDVLVRSGNEISLQRALPAVVEADGRSMGWRTRAATVQGLLDELGIEVSPYDTLIANGVEVTPADALLTAGYARGAPGAFAAVNGGSAAEGLTLTIKRAVPLFIVEDGRRISLKSSKPTLNEALREAGIRLGPADEVYPSPSAAVTAGLEVEVKHAKAINLRMGTSSRVIYTHKESLKDALAESGFSLGADDRVEPSIDVAVSNGMSARLVRVAGRQLLEKETVQRKTVFKPDEALTGAASRVVQGSDGVRVREFRIVIEDGVEKEKKLLKESFDPEVKDTVIYYAASAVRASGMEPESFSASRTARMYATWYNASTSGKAQTDPNYGFTRSGMPVTRGIVAVDPAMIPLGTRLYIPGYGFAVAGDTGGGIIGNMIDLGFPDGVPVDWHTSWVEVYILTS